MDTATEEHCLRAYRHWGCLLNTDTGRLQSCPSPSLWGMWSPPKWMPKTVFLQKQNTYTTAVAEVGDIRSVCTLCCSVCLSQQVYLFCGWLVACPPLVSHLESAGWSKSYRPNQQQKRHEPFQVRPIAAVGSPAGFLITEKATFLETAKYSAHLRSNHKEKEFSL